MPADKREVIDAIEEGVSIHELVLPKKIIGVNGIVSQIECVDMQISGFDKNGRPKPVEVEGSSFTIDADMIIPAVSQYSDLPFVSKDEIEITQYGNFIIDENTFMTTLDGVFAVEML